MDKWAMFRLCRRLGLTFIEGQGTWTIGLIACPACGVYFRFSPRKVTETEIRGWAARHTEEYDSPLTWMGNRVHNSKTAPASRAHYHL